MSQQSAIGTPLQAKPDTTAGNSTTAGAQAGVTPLIDLRQVSKRFGERPVGAAGRALQRLGLSKPPAVTRAVDHVDLIVNPGEVVGLVGCLLYTSPSPRDKRQSRMPSSA